ncbi:hypothetical protein Elgi_72390 [Paenibacillus elgii]|nr:hypothetical protein Elgi_72390 [Paenibacillus elgii]
MKKALIVWGGWPGHQPEEIAGLFRDLLIDEEFEVELSDTLEAFADGEKLKTLDLIVPVWSMGEADPALIRNVSAAVQNGTGLAGCHGGMCDAFRTDVEWHFMTGGQWVAHPGNNEVDYEVKLIPNSNRCWKASAISACGASSIICMSTLRSTFWRQRDSRLRLDLIRRMAPSICPSSGRNGGEQGEYSIARLVIRRTF